MDPFWSPVSVQTPVTVQTLPTLFSELVHSKEHFKSFFHITFPNSMTQVKRNHLSVTFLHNLICMTLMILILYRIYPTVFPIFEVAVLRFLDCKIISNMSESEVTSEAN